MPNPVEGYNMLIWEHEDGSVSYTGSFNRSEWDDYLAASGQESEAEASDSEDGGEQPSDSEPEQPAGNASKDEWREYALFRGASEEDVAELSRNELRDQYGTEES